MTNGNAVPPNADLPPQGPQPMQRAQSTGVHNIGNVLEDVHKILSERMETHGDPGCFAEVFAGMLRPYLQGMMYAARPFLDVDSFAVLEIMKLARQSVAARPLDNAARLDAAGYAVLNAAYMWQPPKVKSGEELFQELLAWAKGDEKSLEGVTFPDHWTMAEGRTYMDYKRAREKRDMEEKEKLQILEKERAATAGLKFENCTYEPGPGGDDWPVTEHMRRQVTEPKRPPREHETTAFPVDLDAIGRAAMGQEGSEGTIAPQEATAGPVDGAEPMARPQRPRRVS